MQNKQARRCRSMCWHQVCTKARLFGCSTAQRSPGRTQACGSCDIGNMDGAVLLPDGSQSQQYAHRCVKTLFAASVPIFNAQLTLAAVRACATCSGYECTTGITTAAGLSSSQWAVTTSQDRLLRFRASRRNAT